MSLTYFLLGLVVLATFMALTKTYKLSRSQLITLGILIVLTTIFDQFLIAFDIVRYNLDNISGIYIGYIPVEDYLYCIGAVIIMPKLWEIFSK